MTLSTCHDFLPCSNLGLNAKVCYADLEMPEGVTLAAKRRDDPIIKIRKRR